MEAESQTRKLKLTAAVIMDYPGASEILVSFPDEWLLVHRMSRGETPLYVAAMSPKPDRVRRDHFYGLPPEVNLELNTYQMYKFYQAWPMPTMYVSWNKTTRTGRVAGMGDLKVQLQPLGQAQAWKGEDIAVLWECYLSSVGRQDNWQETLFEIWQAVERDLQVETIFTEPREPTFEQGYTDFLRQLGYAPHSSYEHWWHKTLAGANSGK